MLEICLEGKLNLLTTHTNTHTRTVPALVPLPGGLWLEPYSVQSLSDRPLSLSPVHSKLCHLFPWLESSFLFSPKYDPITYMDHFPYMLKHRLFISTRQLLKTSQNIFHGVKKYEDASKQLDGLARRLNYTNKARCLRR